MEGRVRIVCVDCGRAEEISGEIPHEYTASMQKAAAAGWVPRPGSSPAWLCGQCLERYEGSETRDDAHKLGLE